MTFSSKIKVYVQYSVEIFIVSSKAWDFEDFPKQKLTIST